MSPAKIDALLTARTSPTTDAGGDKSGANGDKSGANGGKSGAAVSNPLSAKVDKALSKVLDDDNDLLSALADVSTLMADNSVSCRRRLRCAIERRSVATNRRFIEQLSGVRAALDSLHVHVDKMAADCGDICARLGDSRRRGGRLLAITTQLRADADKVDRQRHLLAAYLCRFQLSADEQAALQQQSSAPPGGEFFAALVRARQIHADCRRCVVAAQHKHTLLEVLDQMSLYQEAAYERVFNWAKNRVCCSDLTIDGALVNSMACLLQRPTLFQHVLDEYCCTRRQQLAELFTAALTMGEVGRVCGSRGGSRPIELHAHNPQRYVADMLAWLHQTAPGERDALCQLLAACENASGDLDVAALTDAAASGVWTDVCLPLHARIEQVVAACDSVAVLRRLAGLLDYYRYSALPAAVSGGGGLRRTSVADGRHRLGELAVVLARLHEQTWRRFIDVLRSTTHRLCDRIEPETDSRPVVASQLDVLSSSASSPLPSPQSPSPSQLAAEPDAANLPSSSAESAAENRLQPSAAFGSCLQLLEEAVPRDSESLGCAPLADVSPDSSADQDQVSNRTDDSVECVVEPLLDVIASSAAPLSAHDACIYQLNCLHQLHGRLLQLVATDSRWLQLVKQRQHTQLERAVSEQASAMLEALGLAELYALWQRQQEEATSKEQGKEEGSTSTAILTPLSQYSPAGAVRRTAVRLDAFLADPQQLQLPQLQLLASVQQRVMIRRRAAVVLTVVYERAYEAVHAAVNKYERPDTLLTRTPQQLRTLLDC